MPTAWPRRPSSGKPIQAATEQHCDRTAACAFTTFAAYERTGQPSGNNLHRNDVVPVLPTSHMEACEPDLVSDALRAQCLDDDDLPACDMLTIPHNPNAGGGLMLAGGESISAEEAAARSSIEPAVEKNRHQGDSECRTGIGGSADEECGFEKLNRLQLFSRISDPAQDFKALSYVRNALEKGSSRSSVARAGHGA